MSQRAIAYVQSLQSFLTETEYDVARVLAALARDGDDMAEATMEQIAAGVGVKARCVRYTIRHLESSGLVVQVHQKKGLRRSRTTYTFVELEAERPRVPQDPATVISLAQAMRRKAQAARERARDSRIHGHRDPLLLATIYEDLARTLREESAKQAESTGA
jgi:predicted ArsR family transcriptional regulator